LLDFSVASLNSNLEDWMKMSGAVWYSNTLWSVLMDPDMKNNQSSEWYAGSWKTGCGAYLHTS
jgi:hypothetical protein